MLVQIIAYKFEISHIQIVIIHHGETFFVYELILNGPHTK